MIAFLGNIFSPGYMAARTETATPNPLDFAAFNIAVYGETQSRWCFTEYPKQAVAQHQDGLRIGNSRISTESSGEIRIDIDERSPWMRRPVRGSVILRYDRLYEQIFHLDKAGRHRWHPIAPRCRIEVRLEAPSLYFEGSAYHDMNRGDSALESDFVDWGWSRHTSDEASVVFYDGRRKDGSPFSIAARFDNEGAVDAVQNVPNLVSLPSTFLWQCPRNVRSESSPLLIRTWENSPFYARSMVKTEIFGRPSPTVHETLRLDRLMLASSQRMIPFRLRRFS